MKKIILSALTCFSTLTFAGSSSSGIGMNSDGIVTPDVAYGFRIYNIYNNDTNGTMVICEPENYVLRKGCDNWKPISSIIPSGRTLVGFKILVSSSSNTMLAVFWK